MGQTQILFIVLSVIIVGVAVAVGITQFGENATEANKNALELDCQQIIARAQQWYRKPVELGGGGSTFTDLTLDKIGVAAMNGNVDPEGDGFVLTVNDAKEIMVEVAGREQGVGVRMTYNADSDSWTTEHFTP